MKTTHAFEQLRSLLISDRSIRRFEQNRPIECETLSSLVELTRYCASGRNLQPLRYKLISECSVCDRIFPALAWAGYYKDWDGPAEGERPVAYIVQCLDTNLTNNPMCDEGLNLQTITLGAAALGIGCCIIKSFNKQVIAEELDIAAGMEPEYVIALGYPAEKAIITDCMPDGDIKYYRNESDEQCVPKRMLSELII